MDIKNIFNNIFYCICCRAWW